MCDSGSYFPIAGGWEVAEQCTAEFTTNRRKGVAIEEQKGRETMTPLQEVERFAECDNAGTLGFPFCCARRRSLRVKSVLRATSLARSSVDADDRLPVPVFDKSGSGLKR